MNTASKKNDKGNKKGFTLKAGKAVEPRGIGKPQYFIPRVLLFTSSSCDHLKDNYIATATGESLKPRGSYVTSLI